MGTRSSKYELARIAAALMIILNHIDPGAAPMAGNAVVRANSLLTDLFHMGGKFGVNLFVIIGAWFLCEQPFKARRIRTILCQVIVYAVLLNLVTWAINGRIQTVPEFLHAFNYWFPFAYILMLLATPLLSRICTNARIHNGFLAAGALFFAALFLLRCLVRENRILSLLNMEHVIGPVWFCFLYLVTAKVKKACRIRPPRRYLCLSLAAAGYLLMLLLTKLMGSPAARDMYSPVCALSAMLLFFFFDSLRMRNSSLVNALARATFGTYLFQCHYHFAPILNRFFNYPRWLHSPFYFPFCLGTAVLIFAAAFCITRLISLAEKNGIKSLRSRGGGT